MINATENENGEGALGALKPTLVTRAQAAASLGISDRTLDKLTLRGDVACVRIGRRRLYRPADLCHLADSLLSHPAVSSTN